MSRTIVLFDIDMTLLDFAQDREVLREVIAGFTSDDALHALDPTGRSDRWIVEELARGIGVDADELAPRYAEAYLTALEASLERHGIEALDGVPALLDALAADDATLGLATGNLRDNAALKLRYADLEGHFEPLRGGFGEHSPQRAEIVTAGLREVSRTSGDRAVVIGDTPLDVEAALANGVGAVAVATGRFSVEELESAGASTVLADLGDTGAALEAIERHATAAGR